MWQLRFNNLQVVTIAISLIYFSLHVLPIHAKMEEPASRITRKIVMIVSVEKVSWGTIAREVTLKLLFSFSFENLNLLFLWSSCIFSGFTSIHLLSYFPYSCCDMTFMFYLNSLYLFPLTSIHFRKVLFDIEGRLGQRMLCWMKGWQSFIDAGGYVLCSDWWVVAFAVDVM